MEDKSLNELYQVYTDEQTKKKPVFVDVSDKLIHPISKRAIVRKDADAVNNAIQNIVFTRRGTRPFNLEFGTTVPELLFRPIDHITTALIRDEIEEGINRFEPRVRDLDVEVIPDSAGNAYTVNIRYVMDIAGSVEHAFKLTKIR